MGNFKVVPSTNSRCFASFFIFQVISLLVKEFIRKAILGDLFRVRGWRKYLLWRWIVTMALRRICSPIHIWPRTIVTLVSYLFIALGFFAPLIRKTSIIGCGGESCMDRWWWTGIIRCDTSIATLTIAMNVPTYLLTTLPLVRLRRAAADNIVPHQALRTREDMKSTYFIHIIINDTAGNYLNEVLYHQWIFLWYPSSSKVVQLRF